MDIAKRYEGTEICLCKERTEQLWVTVYAEIKEGKMTVSGQDLGEPCERFWGSDEYEYWYSFDEENTEKILMRLSENDADPIEEFQKRFFGMTAYRKLRSFCETEGIVFRFNNWA